MPYVFRYTYESEDCLLATGHVGEAAVREPTWTHNRL